MKNLITSLLFISCSLYAGRLPDLAFRESLRDYNPAKDVGLKQGFDVAFGRHASLKPLLPKWSRTQEDVVVHRQRLQMLEQSIKVPRIQLSRLRYVPITAEQKTITNR